MYPTEWADKEIYYDRNNWFKSDYMQTGNVEEQLKWVHEGIDKLLADHGYIHENGMFRIEKHSDEAPRVLLSLRRINGDDRTYPWYFHHEYVAWLQYAAYICDSPRL